MNILFSLTFVMLGGIFAFGSCQAQSLAASNEAAPRKDTTPVALPGKTDVRTEFHIKYVGDDVVYLDAGRAAGLAEKMRLTVRRTLTGILPSGIAVSNGGDPQVVAELEVLSVAENSSVCAVKSSAAPLQKGDIAALNAEDTQLSQILRNAGAGRHYAQTITFTEGDPLDEEARDYMPHAPLPEVNRFRGRIGLDYNSIIDTGGTGANGSDIGLSLRADMTRIGGSYWNLSGYSRFRMNSHSAGSQTTLTDLLNRTYTLALTYDSPKSKWTAGVGRLYLPWATSLSTIDGGYLARRLNKKVTIGLFAGGTPDPTSWNYNPQRRMLGSFINFENGSYEGFHSNSTTGIAVSRIGWKPDREFVLFENTLSWKRLVSVYHELEVDQVHASPITIASAPPGISKSFLTLRVEPSKYVEFDLSENYFRDFPTYDPRLLGTGLLDKYLFQGLSGGVRFSLPFRGTVYSNIGQSSRSGDAKPNWNKMFGLGFRNVMHTGIDTDFHLTQFDSSFAKGSYKSVTLTRQLGETLRLMFQAGQQNFGSALTSQSRSRFITSSLDWSFSAHYFLGGGLTVYRGGSQNYDQIYFTLGWRFK
jgi:hypothetical protein